MEYISNISKSMSNCFVYGVSSCNTNETKIKLITTNITYKNAQRNLDHFSRYTIKIQHVNVFGSIMGDAVGVSYLCDVEASLATDVPLVRSEPESINLG